ncbi:MAG TPA: phenylalanine--tRNA ligase subunit alpha [Candidatus Binataceae bacterium]|nr:phenylalanine--tRNA ligase subunit alpha [Candidatus Binataceae bacterium]
MKDQLQEIRTRALSELGDDAAETAIEEVRVRVLGRSGELTEIMRRMREVPPAERPAIGQLVNQIKSELEARIEVLQQKLKQAALEQSLAETRLDVTLPGARMPRGRLHPVTVTIEEMLRIFSAMGFEIVATRDVEDDFHNFAALNFPPDHPAREMQDTFFLGGGLLLRTHTSNGQIRVMEQRRPPLAIVCPGNCYRRDELSVRAAPMFSQIEGFMVDRAGKTTMAHLKGVLTEFLRAFFGPGTAVRFRASFFPFTEPSAEVDISCLLCAGKGCRVCKQSGWTEILGSGMIHPNVFRAVGYDPAEYQGFAFGLGVERTALLKLGVEDMRLFFENDLRFLGQFQASVERFS